MTTTTTAVAAAAAAAAPFNVHQYCSCCSFSRPIKFQHVFDHCRERRQQDQCVLHSFMYVCTCTCLRHCHGEMALASRNLHPLFFLFYFTLRSNCLIAFYARCCFCCCCGVSLCLCASSRFRFDSSKNYNFTTTCTEYTRTHTRICMFIGAYVCWLVAECVCVSQV